ncbi:hypothetical protein C8Q74DRAFT_219252 [Fomes fomentarius]|nr:hypothetical protein C8Q74DRAFT_219252 [Fomes fomentarius]
MESTAHLQLIGSLAGGESRSQHSSHCGTSTWGVHSRPQLAARCQCQSAGWEHLPAAEQQTTVRCGWRASPAVPPPRHVQPTSQPERDVGVGYSRLEGRDSGLSGHAPEQGQPRGFRVSIQCSLHGRMRGRVEVEKGAGSAELWSSGEGVESIRIMGKCAARSAPMSRSSPNSELKLHMMCVLCPRKEKMRYLIAPRVPLICALCTRHGLAEVIRVPCGVHVPAGFSVASHSAPADVHTIPSPEGLRG